MVRHNQKPPALIDEQLVERLMLAAGIAYAAYWLYTLENRVTRLEHKVDRREAMRDLEDDIAPESEGE